MDKTKTRQRRDEALTNLYAVFGEPFSVVKVVSELEIGEVVDEEEVEATEKLLATTKGAFNWNKRRTEFVEQRPKGSRNGLKILKGGDYF